MMNEHIKESYDKHIDRQLSDLMLMDHFLKSPACKEAVNTLQETAAETGIDKDSRVLRKFMRRLLPLVIPPGVKGSIRGITFNKLIKAKLLKAESSLQGTFVFEPKDYCHLVSEVPDWCFCKGDKTIIGYNQLDMWHGGAQINRAAKYILDHNLHRRLNKRNVWIVCVVARKLSIKDAKNKVATIVKEGIKRERLFWPNAIVNYLKTL